MLFAKLTQLPFCQRQKLDPLQSSADTGSFGGHTQPCLLCSAPQDTSGQHFTVGQQGYGKNERDFPNSAPSETPLETPSSKQVP